MCTILLKQLCKDEYDRVYQSLFRITHVVNINCIVDVLLDWMWLLTECINAQNVAICSGSMPCMVKAQVGCASWCTVVSINFSIRPTRLSRKKYFKHIYTYHRLKLQLWNRKGRKSTSGCSSVLAFRWLFSCLTWLCKSNAETEQSDCKSLCERWYLCCSRVWRWIFCGVLVKSFNFFSWQIVVTNEHSYENKCLETFLMLNKENQR